MAIFFNDESKETFFKSSCSSYSRIAKSFLWNNVMKICPFPFFLGLSSRHKISVTKPLRQRRARGFLAEELPPEFFHSSNKFSLNNTG